MGTVVAARKIFGAFEFAAHTGCGSDPATVEIANLNAYAERFVRSIKDECLNRMIFIGEASLRRAVREFMAHYHAERGHQGLGNRLISAEQL